MKPAPLKMPLSVLRGVGPDRSAQLARLEIYTVEDLLLHRPRRYEDRRHFCSLAELRLREAAMTRGTVVALGVKTFRARSKSLFELIIEDGTGRLHCRWWNLPYLRNYFRQGDEVLVYGILLSIKPRTMDHPDTEVIVCGEDNAIHLNRIVPVYPLTEGLPQRWLRALVWRALSDFQADITNAFSNPIISDLPTRAQAIHMIHFPEELNEAATGRQRLALDEFLEFQITILRRRQKLLASARGWPCPGDNRFVKPFLAQLGFKLTGAQTKVLREIRHDLASGLPMRRLLQGDVGSGKTAVAAASTLIALESGYNVALMAPTEILAQQHFQNFIRWFRPLGINVRLHTGSHKSSRVPGLKMGIGCAEESSACDAGSPTHHADHRHSCLDSIRICPGKLGIGDHRRAA